MAMGMITPMPPSQRQLTIVRPCHPNDGDSIRPTLAVFSLGPLRHLAMSAVSVPAHRGARPPDCSPRLPNPAVER